MEAVCKRLRKLFTEWRNIHLFVQVSATRRSHIFCTNSPSRFVFWSRCSSHSSSWLRCASVVSWRSRLTKTRFETWCEKERNRRAFRCARDATAFKLRSAKSDVWWECACVSGARCGDICACAWTASEVTFSQECDGDETETKKVRVYPCYLLLLFNCYSWNVLLICRLTYIKMRGAHTHIPVNYFNQNFVAFSTLIQMFLFNY